MPGGGASPAVCILAHDRPGYLRRVVEALRGQDGLGDTPVHCFLDGSVNPRSGVTRADPEDIARCAEVFTAAFPAGVLHAAPHNLGVALNYERAETHLFTVERHDLVLFMEDDFVPAPHYLTVVRALAGAFGDHPRVGAFNAFGDHDASLAEQRARRREIVGMGHTWAFCVPRRRWEERRPFYAPYLEYIAGVDYVLRSQREIQERVLGLRAPHPVVSSQDTVKAVAMLRAGQVRLSTFTNNGVYIGRTGVHFTPRIFAAMGYERRAHLVFPEAHTEFDWTERDLDAVERAHRAAFGLAP